MEKRGKKSKVKDFPKTYTIIEALKDGDLFTRLTCIFMGMGNFARKQFVQGIGFLAIEIMYLYYMLQIGVNSVYDFITLGSNLQEKVFNEATQLFEYKMGDNSQLCLLYGVVTLFITLAFIILWRAAIRSSYIGYLDQRKGLKPKGIITTIKELFNEKLHYTLLTFPVLGLVVFTIMPLVFMMAMAFTNYDRNHLPPGQLFDWVGISNFVRVLNFNSDLGRTFWPVLGWTLIWAIFATGLNYILGMMLALLINRKRTKCKKMWRFIFALTIAVPQFVSLLVVNTMIQEHGVFNVLLRDIFGIGPIPFLTNATVARITVIVINLWIGIPFTLIQTTGILQNIPTELYESAKVDGASPVVTFFKITLPYMLFVTTPYLITTFVGNINNFNVIRSEERRVGKEC